MKKAIFWHRRDLRIHDNTGLFHSLNSGFKVIPVFIFDRDILDKLENPNDSRISFIYRELEKLKGKYQKFNSDLKIYYGQVNEVWKRIIEDFHPQEVFTNHDYEPYAIKRDKAVQKLLEEYAIRFNTFKDQVIFEKTEVVKEDGTPYKVFTPYANKWKSEFSETDIKAFDVKSKCDNLIPLKREEMILLKAIGFAESEIPFPSPDIDEHIIKNYHKDRDFPAIRGTTRLSVHLRFGTISIRELVLKAFKLNETWLNELIWREFYMMILYHYPRVVNTSFKENYDRIPWRNNEDEFKAWCEGNTGYPIVDAGMRELNKTGFMHNRLRMVVASFLTKHLLIDWRWGEAYFGSKLLDYELSSNNGGWQWAAGSGCDASPYFRVFNPYTQTEKFDKDLDYIKCWVPEYNRPDEYPKPIVEHKFARNRAIETYKNALV